MHEIIVGRRHDDLEKYGNQSAGFIGKHIVGKHSEAHLTNKIFLDFLRPHVILVCGKRGSGKSYTGGVIAEEMALLPDDISQNLSTVMIDTMGIYWSMKYPNDQQLTLLDKWGLDPKGLQDKVNVYVPYQQVEEFKEIEIPVDYGISIPPHEFTAQDWTLAFNLPMTDPLALGLQKTVNRFRRREEKFEINDMISEIKDDRAIDTRTKSALDNMLTVANEWGVFGDKGVKIEEMMKPGKINVFDTSRLRSSEAWSVRNLLVALVSRQIYEKRVMARKQEELAKMGQTKLTKRFPMVWLMIDEAHQFCSNENITASTEPILTIVKQGREPGISLVPMTQMPNKIHQEIISQCDMVLSHSLTSKADITSLHSVMQTYMLEDLQKYIDSLPKWKGASIILDDNSERIYSLQARPRVSWHAGEAAIARV